METADEVLDRLVRWGHAQPLVRAMLLTSTRAIPGAWVDEYSDYDLILALADVQPFYASRAWLAAFGTVLVLYRDPLEGLAGMAKSGYVVQFESGLKIDFTLWGAEILAGIARSPTLPAELDAGYRLLLDKDGLAHGLAAPTYRAYLPSPPSELEYLAAIECTFLEAIYVLKLLARDDLVAAQYVLNTYMRHEHLVPLLEWQVELEHEWSLKTGPFGRGLGRHLRPELWQALLATYTPASASETRLALERTLRLFCQVAREVGARLGYPYPHSLESKTWDFITRLHRA